jgi:hypothetical protein
MVEGEYLVLHGRQRHTLKKFEIAKLLGVTLLPAMISRERA